MNRSDFQQLAHLRLAEAQVLLAAGFPAGAYYLAGYAVEAALKACIAKSYQQYDFPDKGKVLESWSHNLVQLVKTAALDGLLDAAMQHSSTLRANWTIARKWNEAARYREAIPTLEAQDLLAAVGDPVDGVLAWLTNHW